MCCKVSTRTGHLVATDTTGTLMKVGAGAVRVPVFAADIIAWHQSADQLTP